MTLTELQVRNALYPLSDERRRGSSGRRTRRTGTLLPGFPEVSPDDVARALAERIDHFHTSSVIDERIAFIEAKARQARAAGRSASPAPPTSARAARTAPRPGCPRGAAPSEASAATSWPPTWTAATSPTTHMGGEGATWLGQAPFVDRGHVFQNLGDGTYYHSGLLAIRACVAAGVNITYKILFNDAVAMTGGQPHDGPIDPPAISRQVRSEGVDTIRLVTDEPGKYGSGRALRPRHPDRPPA